MPDNKLFCFKMCMSLVMETSQDAQVFYPKPLSVSMGIYASAAHLKLSNEAAGCRRQSDD